LSLFYSFQRVAASTPPCIPQSICSLHSPPARPCSQSSRHRPSRPARGRPSLSGQTLCWTNGKPAAVCVEITPSPISTHLLTPKQCHRDAFLIGVCSQCTWSGRTICECPSAMVEQYCNNELIMCMGQATNVGEMCDVLMCSGAMDGGGGGGAGGSSPKPSGCAAGYKTCAGSWCIKSDEVCCGGDQLGSDSCPKGKVCVKSGTKMMCGNPGSTSGGASAAPAVQGGASGGTGTGPKTASGSRLTTIAGWVGTLGVAVGSVLL